VAQSHTPRNRCVRFVFGVTAASRTYSSRLRAYNTMYGDGEASRKQISAIGAH
jgi:hypothetical protein